MCDSHLRFIYLAVAAPGRTNDCRAFNRLDNLLEWLKKLPKAFFIIGDNAYPLSDALQIPFSGADKHDDFNRAFNYWLSQLRIRIEMAFGLLTTK